MIIFYFIITSMIKSLNLNKLNLFSEFDQVIKGDLKGQDLQRVMEDYNKQVSSNRILPINPFRFDPVEALSKMSNLRCFSFNLNQFA